ncbi:putative nucleoporin 98 [Tieghemostelium lacteum]|uniref:Putative nucleoporin 98 n=1 Tax=Tieghemostelium lacteum TaxID=361077 RepID=A0A151Z828_TIELA|nr:putative nucleoporin 98 [Tieghemostelium lacteum]|eukprot:KYQ90088.1 putative nucleoporin 98 [Tieghemostelium lacteum]
MFSAFGAKPAATSTGFGGGLFGQSTAQPSTTFGGGGLFSGGAQPSTFSAPQSTLFGGTSAQTTQSFGGFGTTNPTTTSSFAPSLLPSTTSTFGTSQPTSTPFGGFGATTAQTSTPFTGLLGAPQQTSSTGSTFFGAPQQTSTFTSFGQTQPTSTGLFGGTTLGTPGGGLGQPQQQQQQMPGTPYPYNSTSVDSNTYISITAMDQYSNKSFEELRLEDIKNNRYLGKNSPPSGLMTPGQSSLGGTSLGGGSTNLFGQTTTQPPNLFGQAQTQPTSPFSSLSTGAPSSPFGQTTTQATSLFGSNTSQPTNSSLFGPTPATQPQALFGQNTSQPTTAGLFGSTPATQPQTQTTNLFGQQPTTTPSLFGQSQTTAQPANTNLFGQPTQTQPTNLFGQPQTQTTANPSIFGQTPATTSTPSLFGQSQTTAQPSGLFGQQQTSASTSLFGPTTSTAQPTNLFGQPQTSAPTTSLFGQTTSTAQPPSLFGQTQTQAQAATSIFGSTATSQPTTSTNLFGSQTSATQPTLSLGSFQTTTPFSLTSQTSSLSQQNAANTSLFGTQPQTSTSLLGQGTLTGFPQNNNATPSLSLAPSLSGTQLSLTSQTSSLAQPNANTSLFGNPQTQQQIQPQQQFLNPQAQQPNYGATGQFGSPYQPIPDINPIKSLVKSVQQSAPTTLGSSIGFNNSSLSTSMLSSQRSNISQPSYLPKSTTKLSLKKSFGLDSDGDQSSLSSGSNSDTNSGLFTGMKFISKYQKNLNINTQDLTEDKLKKAKPQQTMNQQATSSSLFNNNNNVQQSSSTSEPQQQQNLQSSNGLHSTSPTGSGLSNLTSFQPVLNNSTSSTFNNVNNNVQPQQQQQVQQKNPRAPKLDNPSCDLVFTPTLEELSTKSDQQLANVDNFRVSNKYGILQYEEPVDLREQVLDKIISIKHNIVSVYDEEYGDKPPMGKGLNHKANITLFDIKPAKGSIEQFREKILKIHKRDGSEFISYEDSTWRFRVKHFSKYGLLDDDDEEMENTPTTKPTSTTTTVPQVTEKPKVTTTTTAPKTKSRFSAPIDMDSDSDDTSNEEEVDAPQKKHQKLFPKSFNASVQTNTGLFNQPSSMVSQLSQPQSTIPPVSRSEENQSKMARSNFQVSTNFPVMSKVPSQSQFKNNVQQATKPLVLPVAPIPQQHSNNFQVLTNQVVPELNKMPAITLDNTLIPTKKSVVSQYIKSTSRADESFTMRRSFRVSFTTSGKLVSLSKSKLNCLVISKIPVNTNTGNKNDLKIIEFLRSHISNSSLIPSEKVAQREAYGLFQLSNVQEQIQSQLSGEKNDYSDYYTRIWSLLLNLFGDMESSASNKSSQDQLLARKVKINQWLKAAIEPLVNEELKSNNPYLDQLFINLTGKKVVKASELANANKDYRLATMMSQVWSVPMGKKYLLEQINQYKQRGLDKFIDAKRMQILQLLSGEIDPVYKDINDWIRSFAINYWYKFSLGDSNLQEVLKSYQDSYSANRSIAPFPPHLVDPKQRYQSKVIPYYDACYLLLNLFISTDSSTLSSLIHPGNIGRDKLDYFMPWALNSVLTSIPSLCSIPEIKNQSTLHSSFAMQLESMGHWQWAIYVLLHSKYQTIQFREQSITSLLSRYAHKMTESDRKFLVDQLKLPQLWLDQVYSWYLSYQASSVSPSELNNPQMDRNRIEYFFKSNQFSQAHELLLNNLGPIAIIQSDYDELQKYLLDLQPYNNQISNWQSGGSIYLEFIEISINVRAVIRSFSQRQVSGLSQKLQQLKEMSKRIDQLSLVIPKDLSSKLYPENFRVSLKEISKYLLQLKISLQDLFQINKLETDHTLDYVNCLDLNEENRSLFIDNLSEKIQHDILSSIY